MESPLVSAIVLNFRTPEAAIRCVHALLRQTLADRLEVLLVDNHSLDDSMGVFRTRFNGDPRVRVIETNCNRGYGGGNNFALPFVRGEYLLVINPDNELEPEGLERLIGALREDSTIGIIAPRLVYDDESVRDSHRSFPTLLDVFIKRTFFRHFFKRRMDRYLERDRVTSLPQDTDWVHGACFLMKTAFFRELQGFDPRFFLFFEDTDLCRRCRNAGKRVVFDPRVSAKDRKARLSEGGVLSLLTKSTAREHLRSAFRYFWKWRRAKKL